MEELLNQIRNRRTQKGFTQEYMALQLGMDRVNYANIEKGKSKLTVERLYKIAEILETSVMDIITFDPKAYKGVSFELPYKSVVEESQVPYHRNNMEIELLKRENELLQKSLEDKEEIIRLLKNK